MYIYIYIYNYLYPYFLLKKLKSHVRITLDRKDKEGEG